MPLFSHRTAPRLVIAMPNARCWTKCLQHSSSSATHSLTGSQPFQNSQSRTAIPPKQYPTAAILWLSHCNMSRIASYAFIIRPAINVRSSCSGRLAAMFSSLSHRARPAPYKSTPNAYVQHRTKMLDFLAIKCLAQPSPDLTEFARATQFGKRRSSLKSDRTFLYLLQRRIHRRNEQEEKACSRIISKMQARPKRSDFVVQTNQ